MMLLLFDVTEAESAPSNVVLGLGTIAVPQSASTVTRPETRVSVWVVLRCC
jgi:hypothetical protein